MVEAGMRGHVTVGREAVLSLSVHGPLGRRLRVRAVIDTGFSGWLTLPKPLISRLQLPWRQIDIATLADGSNTAFDTYYATVTWDRRRRKIVVDAADTGPLLGMAMLEGYEVNIQVRRNGVVMLSKL
jgi:clan AA aspartic protease